MRLRQSRLASSGRRDLPIFQCQGFHTFLNDIPDAPFADFCQHGFGFSDTAENITFRDAGTSNPIFQRRDRATILLQEGQFITSEDVLYRKAWAENPGK